MDQPARSVPPIASIESGERWRIGALAARTGVTETLLRAWETRYGLLDPIRSTSGYRLYGPEDERRIRAMMAARERGLPAARAAAEVLSAERAPGGLGAREPTGVGSSAAPADASTAELVASAVEDLWTAMLTHDSTAMHDVVDRVLRVLSVESTIRDVLLPFMHRVGADWAADRIDIADEHFATDVVRSRFAALTVGGNPRRGPLVLLACPPDEGHDLALKAFEVILQRSGWRTRFLGAHTPALAILAAAHVVDPDLVILAGTRRAVFDLDPAVVADLRGGWPLVLAGPGATADLASSWDALHLTGDPVAGAQTLLAQRLLLTSPSSPAAATAEGTP